MNRFLKFSLALMFVFSAASFSAATDIYVAQNTTGGDTGADCADAHSAAWFNSSGNWGSGGGQIGPGTIVHLCATFTGAAGSTMLTTQANGAAGNVITIVFENGAILTSPAWGNSGAINVPNNYIVVDGVCTGSNSAGQCTSTQGTIQNTTVGTAGGACLAGPCTSQQYATKGVQVSGSNDTIKNLTLTHIWVHTFQTTDATTYDGSTAIGANGANNLVSNNIIDNSYSGVGMGANSSGTEVSFNTISFSNHHITMGINAGTVTGIKVHDNDLSNAYNWDDTGNRYHHNGIMTFTDPAGTITGDYYNNYIHGTFTKDTVYGGSHTTALIFLEYDSGNSRVFNNVLALDSGDPYGTANAMITIGGAGTGTREVYNNTLYMANQNGTCFGGDHGTLIVKNNIMVHCGYGITVSNPVTLISDYNTFFNLSGNGEFQIPGQGCCLDFSSWQSHGYDAHGQNGNDPKLDTSTWMLQSGSSAIGFGTNLTSLGISALDSDKAGVPRPANGNWDDGAYQFSNNPPPAPPSGLTAVVK